MALAEMSVYLDYRREAFFSLVRLFRKKPEKTTTGNKKQKRTAKQRFVASARVVCPGEIVSVKKSLFGKIPVRPSNHVDSRRITRVV